MTVNQGLKSFAESSPEFTNQGISNLINVVNTGWVAKNRLLAQKIFFLLTIFFCLLMKVKFSLK